jgi:glycine/D-amino acid oxidase-like deaminating enzyme
MKHFFHKEIHHASLWIPLTVVILIVIALSLLYTQVGSGLRLGKQVVMCTNGFENFDIYGPYNFKIDKEFHHNVSGLIGYMIGTFTKDKEVDDGGGVFYEDGYKHKELPFEAGPYVYYTKRHFDMGFENGELFCLGGPEIKLHDRRIYKRDHEVDEKIYKELEDFQRNIFSIENEPFFKWHGLMGYTKTGIRIVGFDKRFPNLFYNLGCNGIGLLPSVAGARRIGRLISGEKLEKSIFDPR